jgi:acyl-CoA synthetase (NDP forming)
MTRAADTATAPAAPPARRDLEPLFAPRSVAVVGASDDPAKWGHWLARGALAGAARRAVHLVNRRGGEVLGRPALRSLAEAGEAVECVVVAVPASAFEAAVDDALAVGARAIVCISAGLGERGADGRERERAVVRRVRDADAVLLGPNCLGVFDAGAELQLTSNALPAGGLALVSQSGNLALELGMLADAAGMGFSRFASLGNQADLEAADVVAALADHDGTEVIALYLEDFREGRALARAAAASAKPVVLLTVGASAAAARAAASHTGALASDSSAVDAFCAAAGIERVATPRELIDLAHALRVPALPRGRRLAILGDGGGHGAVAADVAAAHGLDVPAFGDALRGRLAGFLPDTASTANPVDLAGGGEQDIRCFRLAAEALAASGEVDAVLLTGYFGGYGEYGADLGRLEVEVARGIAAAAAGDVPLLAHSMYHASAAARALRDGGVPVYGAIEAAAWAASRLAARAARPAPSVPAVPPPAPPLAAGGYWDARRLVAEAGVPMVAARRARSAAEALAAAADIGYPVALKALGRSHKSDGGGVRLGIADAGALAAAIADMEAALAPPEYSVEAMADGRDAVEILIGARRDARVGPIAVVALGGVFAELLDDAAVALAPADEVTAEALLRSLRGAAILDGARGRPAVDVAAAARAAAALSRAAAAHPELAAVEVNPLLVTPAGALALDARVATDD